MIIEGNSNMETLDTMERVFREVRPSGETRKVDISYRKVDGTRIFDAGEQSRHNSNDIMYWVYIDAPETAKVTARVDGRTIDIEKARSFKFIFPVSVVQFRISGVSDRDVTSVSVMITGRFWNFNVNIMFYVPELKLLSTWIFSLSLYMPLILIEQGVTVGGD